MQLPAAVAQAHEGLVLLVVAISSAVLLILDVALGRWQGLVGGGLVAVTGVLIWYVLPVRVRQSGNANGPGSNMMSGVTCRASPRA